MQVCRALPCKSIATESSQLFLLPSLTSLSFTTSTTPNTLFYTLISYLLPITTQTKWVSPTVRSPFFPHHIYHHRHQHLTARGGGGGDDPMCCGVFHTRTGKTRIYYGLRRRLVFIAGCWSQQSQHRSNQQKKSKQMTNDDHR